MKVPQVWRRLVLFVLRAPVMLSTVAYFMDQVMALASETPDGTDSVGMLMVSYRLPASSSAA